MADTQDSPISQLLNSLGLTREDLNKRSNQMRQFLTAENTSLRVLDHDNANASNPRPDFHTHSQASTSNTSISRSRSLSNATSFRDASPPGTPVKSEPHEAAVPLRHFDSMEMVIERKSRQSKRDKRGRKDKERESASRAAIPSPSSTNTSNPAFSLDNFMRSRDDRRVLPGGTSDSATLQEQETWSIAPVTPQRGKYYRDHTHDASASRSRKVSITPQADSPIGSLHRSNSHPHATLPPLPKPQFPLIRPTSSIAPVTPQHKRVMASGGSLKSPLPASSPPPSSPLSSPSRRVVNLVSSPGPMGPLPLEEEYDTLPYTLPPGPYSGNKPDLSYAALVGQAILSSPEHRLTLQEIYDWITIVYPFFKRGETTWMNSIRHVLSTTICFRKVTRERAVGRTLWAIWDEDLECFRGGGFKKQFCPDMMIHVKEKESSKKPAKARGRKRLASDEGVEEGGAQGDAAVGNERKAKKPKKDKPAHAPRLLAAAPPVHPAYLVPAGYALPMYSRAGPTPHHQPYYPTYPKPSNLVYAPLPLGSVFHPLMTNAPPPAPTPQVSSVVTEDSAESRPKSPSGHTHAPTPSSSLSSISVPELTPNRSSSSPPCSLPPSSEVDVDAEIVDLERDLCNIEAPISVSRTNSLDTSSADDDNVFGSPLRPVQFWGDTTKTIDALEPGITLLNYDYNSGREEEEQPQRSKKGTKSKRKQEKAQKQKCLPLPPVSGSPTLARKGKSSRSSPTTMTRLLTPPPNERPSTPPRRLDTQISAVRTPLSHKGLHMSPSTSLAHYKSHLNPPPVATFGLSPADHAHKGFDEQDDDGQVAVDSENVRTPSRKRTVSSTSAVFPPVTPKKLIFPTSNTNDSPFRTPLGLGASPFRTPGSRGIFDPHDPGSLLDDELSRMGALHGDSPDGLFGRGRGALLYESPNALEGSPSRWKRWW